MPDGVRSATVAVACADESAREVLARILEADGHEAIRVAEPDQSVKAAVDVAADALVLDLAAGNLALLNELRGNGSPVAAQARAVVLATGPANARLAWQAGADAVLTRPFEATELGWELAAALGRSEDERTRARLDGAAGA